MPGHLPDAEMGGTVANSGRLARPDGSKDPQGETRPAQ